MKTRKRWYLLGGGIALLIMLFIGGKEWLKAAQTTEVLSQEEARALIEEKYPGKVMSARLENDLYTVDLERETGTYEIAVNIRNGEVVSLQRIGQTIAPSSQNKEISPAQPSEQDDNASQSATENQNDSTAETAKRLTQEEAVQIALQQVSGQIDDIELERVNGVSYYFVEVENNQDKEAEIQIDAITGEVKSVTWDD